MGALQLGLGVALDYILDMGIDAIWERVQFLAGLLRDKLREVPEVTVQDKGRLLCGIVSFTMVGCKVHNNGMPSSSACAFMVSSGVH